MIAFLTRIERGVCKLVKILSSVRSKEQSARLYRGVSITDSNNVEIGERVSFGGQVRIHSDAYVKIGSDCMIAHGVQIITPSHDHNNHPMWKMRITRPIEIGNHVWIGANAIVLGGVRVGSYAVIGAGTVVAAHVPEKAIVAGNPARILRYRVLHEYDDTCEYPGRVEPRDFLLSDRITKEMRVP